MVMQYGLFGTRCDERGEEDSRPGVDCRAARSRAGGAFADRGLLPHRRDPVSGVATDVDTGLRR